MEMPEKSVNITQFRQPRLKGISCVPVLRESVLHTLNEISVSGFLPVIKVKPVPDDKYILRSFIRTDAVSRIKRLIIIIIHRHTSLYACRYAVSSAISIISRKDSRISCAVSA